MLFAQTKTDYFNCLLYKNAAETPCGLSLGMNVALPFRWQDIRALRNLAGALRKMLYKYQRDNDLRKI